MLTYVQAGKNYRANRTLGPGLESVGIPGGWSVAHECQRPSCNRLRIATAPTNFDDVVVARRGACVTLLGRVAQPVEAYVVPVDPPGGPLQYRFYDVVTFRLIASRRFATVVG